MIFNLMSKIKRRYLLILGFIFICCIFIIYSYGHIILYLNLITSKLLSRVPGGSSYDEYREISTYRDLWMNGYLGVFLRFDKFGYLNCLAIPFLIHFILDVRHRSRWEVAFALTYILSFILISLKGFYNFRYAFTLAPFTLTFVLVEGGYVFRSKKIKYLFYLFCVLLVFCSYYEQRSWYLNLLNNTLVKKNWDLLPTRMINYLNDGSKVHSGNILVCNQPWFYYYTSKKGIEYMRPLISKLEESPNKKDALDILESMGIKYILVGPSYNRSSFGSYKGKRIGEIINNETFPIFEDRDVRLHLIIKNRDQLYNDLYEPVFSKKSLIKNGSFEHWQANRNLLPDFWYIGTGSVQKEKSDKKVGKYAVKITGDNFNFYQNINLSGLAPEKKMSCFAWIKTAVSDKYRIQIYDGIDSSLSERHTGDGKWQLLRAMHTINPKAKYLQVRIVQAERTNGLNDVVYVDGVLLFTGEYYSPNALIMEQDHLMHPVSKESTSR